MTQIRLLAPTRDDIADLLAFERANRRWFEAHVGPRPSGYHSRAGIEAAIEAAMAEAANGLAFQFLVRDGDDALVGRVNLTRIRRAPLHCAELGYRIAQSSCGRGYAGEAVGRALSHAFVTQGLSRIEAVAAVTNQSSIRVLLRNGFVQFGHSRQSLELAGSWHDRLYFERHAPDMADLEPP